MTLVSALVGVLAPDVVTGVTEADSVSLRERKADMRVTVVGVPASVAAIRLERVGHASKLGHPYKKPAGWWRGLDAIGGRDERQ